MYSKFLKDTCSGSDRIRSAEERKRSLLRSGQQAPGCSLVSGYIPIKSLFLLSRLDCICVRDSLYVGRVIEAILENLLVRLDQFRFLLSELFLQILENILQRTAIDVTSHSESEHILTFCDSLSIKTAILQTLRSESGDGSGDDNPVLDMEFSDRILSQSGPFKAILVKCIRVEKNHCSPLQPFCIGFESRRIHSHQQVAEVTWGRDLPASDMNLKTRHTGNSSMGSPDFRRIIREC